MSRMTMRRTRALMALLAIWTVAAVAPTPAVAQQDRDREACRCVDADGNEIENCTCFRAFSPRDGDGVAELFGFRQRGRLGVSVRTDQLDRYDARGARVTDVVRDGPAWEAGLREGDIITRLDGHSLFDPLEADVENDFDLDRSIPVQRLLALSRELDADQEVEVEYLRDGESHRTTLTTGDVAPWGVYSLDEAPFRGLRDGMRALERGLGEGGRFEFRGPEGGEFHFRAPGGGAFELREAPEGRLRRFGEEGGVFFRDDDRFDECPTDGNAPSGARVWVVGDACLGGLDLVALKPGLATYFGTDGGVLVADVHPESPVGLEPGDVILRIGDRDAESPDRVRRLLRTYEPDEDITFHIRRRDREMSVQGRIGR